MIRDQFYQDILNRLDGPLDAEAFERCAQDLLRNIYPTLVPIRGGNDGGMDGITSDLDGREIVLIATVGVRVERNLKTSISSMLDNKNPCRNVILATSRKVTKDKRKLLRKAASELGFRLVQIHDRAAIADLLHGSPKWCKELLNLTGDPPPLSVIPKSMRPAISDFLIGRDGYVKWLTEKRGNRLLVGQPGSGKTFLMSELAKQHGWLFVVTQDMGQIANGIRSQKPTALIVDDAHVDTDFLANLTRLLKEIGAELPIIATSWPGARRDVELALNLTTQQVHELELLTRPEIMTILESVGITGPDHLIYQLLNQAEGRPGLAITLAHACIAGNECDLERVVFGDALVSNVESTFQDLTGTSVVEILGAFATGGGAGMTMEVIAKFLGKSTMEIRQAVTNLSAGGIVHDVDGRHLSVRPRELRHALIRDVFFSGAASLNMLPLLEQAPSCVHTAEALVGACHHGATVQPDLLKRLLEHANSQSAWESYAWLGTDQAKHTLDVHPELVTSLSLPTLNNAPQTAIPLLLQRAIGDNRELHSHTKHSLRLVQDWIRRGLPGTGEAVSRRRTLLHSARQWSRS